LQFQQLVTGTPSTRFVCGCESGIASLSIVRQHNLPALRRKNHPEIMSLFAGVKLPCRQEITP
jgi:hypothetical protein